MMNLKTLTVALTAALALSACTRQTEKTIIQYMPHMANTPNLKPQRGYEGFGDREGMKGTGMMMPPEGTIARGHKPYRFESPEEADAKLKNPLVDNRATLERGRKIFNIYCLVCHGPRGHGDGPVVNPFPIPKSLQSDDMLKWGDGHLFHVITKGQGVMPSYAQQIQPEDRWAVIRYVRALQRADHPTDADVQELKKLSGQK
jgi:mono/diheme cytochrome c family protein